MHARDNLRVGDLLEIKRERFAALIRVVETVLDCVCWGLSKCVSERCGGASKILNVANNDLLMKASPRRMSELERDWRELVTKRGTPWCGSMSAVECRREKNRVCVLKCCNNG